MRSGELRHVVVIESAANTRTATGGIVQSPWAEVATVRAKIETLAAEERIVGDQFAVQTTHTVTIRWRDDVSAQMRLRWGSKVFDILGVSSIKDQRREMVLQCREGESKGS